MQAERAFVAEGGFRERLTRARLAQLAKVSWVRWYNVSISLESSRGDGRHG